MVTMVTDTMATMVTDTIVTQTMVLFQKQFREDYNGEFKRRVRACVRKSQEF